MSFLCFLCHNEIPGAAAHVTTEHGAVLCDRCTDDGHAWMYPLCDTAPHGVTDHLVVIGTSLSAHRALMHIRDAEAVAAHDE